MVASSCPGADIVTPVLVTDNVSTLLPLASVTPTDFVSVPLTLVVRDTPPLVNVFASVVVVSVLPLPPPHADT